MHFQNFCHFRFSMCIYVLQQNRTFLKGKINLKWSNLHCKDKQCSSNTNWYFNKITRLNKNPTYSKHLYIKMSVCNRIIFIGIRCSVNLKLYEEQQLPGRHRSNNLDKSVCMEILAQNTCIPEHLQYNIVILKQLA